MEREQVYPREKYIDIMKNREINIYELFKYVLNKWKSLFVLCVIFFVFFVLVMSFIFRPNESDVSKVTLGQLTEEQQEKISSVLKLYGEIEEMEEYEKSSTRMNLNPYECNITILQYIITDKTIAGNGFKAYKAFSDSGKLKKVIEDEMGEEIAKPSELISSFTYEQSLMGKGDEETEVSQILCIKIITSDENVSNRIAQIVKKSFKEYHEYLLSVVKEHDIKLLAENNYDGTDQDTKDKQSAFEIEIDRKKGQISSLEENLDDEEREVLEQLKGSEMNENNDVVLQRSRFSWKIIIMALLMSVGVSCVILVCYYVFFFNSKVKGGEELISIFGLNCLGEVSKRDSSKDNLILQEELEIFCSKIGMNKLFLSMTTKSEEIETSINLLKESMKVKGIELIVGENIIDNIEAMKSVQYYKNLILISESKKTSYVDIDKILQKCNSWEISVIGVINYKD